MKATGNCYQNCAELLLNVLNNSDFKLVHATATGAKGSKIEGVEYGHAYLINENLGIVLDNTKGDVISCELSRYRKLSQIKNETIYTIEEVRKQLVETGIWGPWK